VCLVNRKEAEIKEEIRVTRSPRDFSNLDFRNEGSESAQSHLINAIETDSINLSRPDQTFLYFLRLHEVVMVRAMLVRIGNSRGIGLAKPLLEIAGLVNEVDIAAAPGVLTIRPSVHLRAGWAEAAAACDAEGLLDEMTATCFEDEEWAW
jgi:antitoxin MazE